MKFSLKKKLKSINTIAFDFDGVMTNNTVLIDQQGNEFVFVSRADGQGVKLLKELGYKILIISSETNSIVIKRAEKLGIPVFNSVDNKGEMIKEFMITNDIMRENVMFVGNDINDLSAFKVVGCSVVPHDAHISVSKIADLKLKTYGGAGVIRELADVMLSYGCYSESKGQASNNR